MSSIESLSTILLERIALSEPRTVAMLSCTNKAFRDCLKSDAERIAGYVAPMMASVRSKKAAARDQLDAAHDALQALDAKKREQKKYFTTGLLLHRTPEKLLARMSAHPIRRAEKSVLKAATEAPLTTMCELGAAIGVAPLTAFRLIEANFWINRSHEDDTDALKMQLAEARDTSEEMRCRIDETIERAEKKDPRAKIPRGYERLPPPRPIASQEQSWEYRAPSMKTLQAWVNEKGISKLDRADRHKAAQIIKEKSKRTRKELGWPNHGEYGAKYLRLANLEHLTTLPPFGHRMSLLSLQGCTALERLPAGLTVGTLMISGSPALDRNPPPGLVIEHSVLGGPPAYASAELPAEVSAQIYRREHGLEP